MAKRTAKPRSRRRAPTGLTRKQQSRVERERRLRRILLISVTVVAVAVVGVLGYGVVSEYVIEARAPVATVGDTQIRTREFQARVRFLRANMALQLEQWRQQRTEIDPEDEASDLVLNYIDQNVSQLEATLAEANKDLIGAQAVDQLIRFELVRREAITRGIEATPDEVQQNIELDFQYDRFAEAMPLDETETVTETAPSGDDTSGAVTEEDFREQYAFFLDNVLEPLGISEDLYRSWAEAELLEERLRQEYRAELPEEAEQIAYRAIVIGDTVQAYELANRLGRGESFQALVDEIESSEETTDYVQEVDWLALQQLEDSVGPTGAQELWEAPVGETVGPISGDTRNTYYLAEIQGHEVRALDPEVINSVANARFEEWLASQRDSLVEIHSYQDRTPTNP